MQQANIEKDVWSAWKIVLVLGFWFILRIFIESLVLKIVTSSKDIFFPYYTIFSLFLFFTLIVLVFSIRRPLLLIFFYIICSLYLFSHLNYFFYYHIPMDLLGVMTVAGDGIDAFFHGSTEIRYELLLAILDLPLVIYIIIHYRKIRNGLKRISRQSVYVTVFLVLFLSFQVDRLSAEAGNSSLTHSELIRNHGLLIYSAAKQFVFPPENREVLIAQKESDGTVFKRDIKGRIVKIVNSVQLGYKKYLGRKNADYNFLLIQVESLQSGMERMSHNGKLIMPYLNSLCGESVYYPYCFSYHTAGGTSDCEISVFDNIEPEDGKRMTSRNFGHENSFVKLMPDYNKLIFHNYIKSFFNRGKSYPKIGFDHFYDFDDMELPGKAWGSEDRLMWGYILGHKEKWQKPFLHYAITLTSHPGFGHIIYYHDAKFLKDIKRKRDKDALNSFNYVDIQLSKFIPAYRKYFPHAWIFIFGDHSLGTVQFAGHLERSAVTLDGDFLEFVPLFILAPDGRIKKKDETLASFHDIGPTVLSLSRRPADEEFISYLAYGGSLLDDDVNEMPVPFNGKLLNRTRLLKAVKDVIEPYFSTDADRADD